MRGTVKNLALKTGSLLLDADNIDISKNLILINSIDMDKTYFTIENFQGDNPQPKPPYVRDSGLYFNPSKIRLQISSLKITNSFFGTGTRGEIPQKGHFDGKHI